LIFEAPRRDQQYVVSVDVGDGIGQDRSVIDVTRVGTIRDPDEQVATWVDDQTDPLSLAPLVDCIGRLYGGTETEAVVAIECNNHGLVTQGELQRHLGYQNFFIWQVMDAADPERAYTTKIGWWTNQRTRPIILARFFKKLKAIDAQGRPDYWINSPFLIQELATFRTLGGIREAEADPSDPDAHDDALMAAAIGLQVCSTLQYEEREPIDQARKRLAEEKARKAESDGTWAGGRDYQNTEATLEEMNEGAPRALAEHRWAQGQDTEW
jgi:hypothetical protein